jgi:hypothetical protein
MSTDQLRLRVHQAIDYKQDASRKHFHFVVAEALVSITPSVRNPLHKRQTILPLAGGQDTEMPGIEGIRVRVLG